MNEIEFKRYILNQMKNNKKLALWYSNNLYNSGFSLTESIIQNGIEKKELTIIEAIQLSLFIGMSTS